jgi:hypothetical protein
MLAAMNSFVKESIPYITTNSINNLIEKLPGNNLNDLLTENDIYMSLINSDYTYLLVCILDKNTNRYVLKFDSPDTAKYIINKYSLFYTHRNDNINVNYNEIQLDQDNYSYNIIFTRYKPEINFSLIDSSSRKSVLTCVYSLPLIIHLDKFATIRLKKLSSYNEHDTITIDKLPINIRKQIQAVTIALSLRG